MAVNLEGLNAPQREAVLCTEGPLLVLAGAGSGKTRVLTYRIAHLVQDLQVAPWQILAITFTNKAANEMRGRLGDLIGPYSRGMWVSTFHSMCVRILRADCEHIGFRRGFTIYDDDDSKRLVKQIVAELNIDERHFPIPSLRNRISQAKNELILPEEFAAQAKDPISKTVARVYTRLQERLHELNAFDFDDLLLYAWVLLKNNPEVLNAYQQRFRYILVDEYQDTNHAQYGLTQLLAAAYQNIMVVGDDDQSIYSWRGADLRNILDFEEDYPNAQVVKLEENYRSTGNILDAANAVIANNITRKQKRLFTSAGAGEKVAVYAANDERDEGSWIAGEIEKLHAQGTSYNSIAVFYRTNAQSRMLEDMLLRAGVPYRLIGGTRFFDRAEIRDVMAYLNVVVNPDNDIAAMRVINTPKRGIGKTTIEHIQAVQRAGNCTFLEAAELCTADEGIRAKTRKAIGEFTSLIRRAQTYEGTLRSVIEAIVNESGLMAALYAEESDDAASRIENIQELYGVVDEYVEQHEEADALFEAPTVVEGTSRTVEASRGATSTASFEEAEPWQHMLAEIEPPVRVLQANSLADFVEWVTLRTDMDTAVEGGAAVTLMTIHSAKGLEFDCVFVAGMEDTIFPHASSMYDPQGLEEERRLAYVAITRARKRLYLTYAFTRRLFGESHTNPPSHFIGEIPEELRVSMGVGSAGFSGSGWEKRGSRRGIAGSGTEAGGGKVFGQSSASGSRQRQVPHAGAVPSKDVGKKAAAGMTFAVGDTVNHKVFGKGSVLKVDGDTLHVRFARTGQTKKLLKDYAPIVKISS